MKTRIGLYVTDTGSGRKVAGVPLIDVSAAVIANGGRILAGFLGGFVVSKKTT